MSQPSGGVGSPKQTSQPSDSHGLPQSSLGVQVSQFSIVAIEQSSPDPRKMKTGPSSVWISQHPKQSQPLGTNIAQYSMHSGVCVGMFSQLLPPVYSHPMSAPGFIGSQVRLQSQPSLP